MGAAIEAYKWEKGEPKKKLTQYRVELQQKLDELLGATREAEGAAVQKSACAWKRYKPNELGQRSLRPGTWPPMWSGFWLPSIGHRSP